MRKKYGAVEPSRARTQRPIGPQNRASARKHAVWQGGRVTAAAGRYESISRQTLACANPGRCDAAMAHAARHDELAQHPAVQFRLCPNTKALQWLGSSSSRQGRKPAHPAQRMPWLPECRICGFLQQGRTACCRIACRAPQPTHPQWRGIA